ncbi:MAG TPA: hypothetical protein DDZ34_04785 [Syntrophaceae bacterium]|nr:hypothetical protein [Syntrophaceae bacterium]
MNKILFMILLASLLLVGCATIQAPQGVDNSIFSQTKKKTVILNDSNKKRSLSFVEGPAMAIDENNHNIYSLTKFKNANGEIRYRLIYKCVGIWVGSAIERNTGTSLHKDLISQDDINGYVLEAGAIDIDRHLLDESLDSGMKIVLTSKGSGTVLTPSPEMRKAMSRNDFNELEKLIKSGHGNQSKYENKSATINIPPAYLKAFLAKSDLIEL